LFGHSRSLAREQVGIVGPALWQLAQMKRSREPLFGVLAFPRGGPEVSNGYRFQI